MNAAKPTRAKDLPLWAVRLKEVREAKGLTQEELGNIIGKSQQTIHGYESGARKPKIPTYRKIAAACDVSEIYLVPREDIVGEIPNSAGCDPDSDKPLPDVIPEIDKESARYAWTINQARKVLAEEHFHPDGDYIFGYADKLMRLVKDVPDDAHAKDLILRAIERDREDWRRQLKILKDKYL
jgi:transcriptional regulator with XRE-family HTH domain